MKHAIASFLALFAVWLLLSGIYKPFLLSMGALSCLLTVLLVRRMRILDAESAPVHLLPGGLTYLPWLTVEIVKANLDVLRRVLSPSLPVSPTLVEVPADQKTELCQVVYAHSITLTPGTVSVDLQDGRILVHALSREGAADIAEGTMNRRVCKLEGSA